MVQDSPKAALAEVTAILKEDPSFAPGYRLLAVMALNENKPEKAVELATKAIARDEKFAEALVVRAIAYERLNRLQEALGDLNTSLELRPFSTFVEPPDQSYSLRASLLERLGRFTEAAQSYQVALKINPASFEAARGLWSAYFYMGKVQIAYHLASDLRRKWPKAVDALSAYALSAASIGEVEAGLDAANEAVGLDARNADVHYVLATVRLAQEEYAEALAQYDNALELDAANLMAMRGKILLLSSCAEAKYREGRSARELAGKLCQLTNNEDPRSMLLLATAHAECGDFDEAVVAVKKALLSPRLSPLMREWGERLMKQFEKLAPYRFEPGQSAPGLPIVPRKRAAV
jgi:tetratricopeptide (TPR) repeat protein